jgi:putative spermidine/putrescine transport system substrate-binding protein
MGSEIRNAIALGAATRRSILKGAGALAASALTMPYVGRARAADPLYVNTWGGPWEEAAKKHLFEPFTAETGIEIRTVSPVSFAKLAAQVQTGTYEFDVTTLGGGDIVRANQAGLLAEIEEPFPGGLFENGAASHAFATVIAWRTDKFPNGGPQNWAEFWDVEKFPGARCLQRYSARIIPIALLADGVPIDKLYPLDVDRAFAALDRIKPHIRVWWTAGNQSTQVLRDGEVDLIGIWHGRYFEAEDAGAPVAMTWNQGEIERAYWVVAKGSPNEAAAKQFVKFATSPKPLAGFCIAGNYGPLNPASAEFVQEKDLARMPTAPKTYPLTFEQDMANFGANPEEVAQRFEEWIAT